MRIKAQLREIGMRIASIVLVACALAVALPLQAGAQDPPPWPAAYCTQDQLGEQTILICLPPGLPGDPRANWNGQLVVYTHGYVAPQLPLALPAEELARAPGMVDFLLSQGYAFATTSYSKNGYAVEAARKDLNELVRHFKTHVLPNAGLLNKVLIVGASEGGLITTMMVEKYPDIYAGGLAMCGPIGGMPAQAEYLLDFRVVFDAFFPNVFGFGAVDVPGNAVMNWETIYQPGIPLALAAAPLATEQLFAVTGAPFDPGDLTTYGETTLSVLYYSIWGTNDMLATAGGIPYDNQDTWYTGSLSDPLLNAAVERIDSDGRARAFVRRAYEPTGDLERPLVTIHNTLDPQVPYWHELDYGALAMPSGYFVPITVPGYGHCEFDAQEILAAFGVLTTMVGP
jgi:pimeloyl-ACP methyl ester carboxylesterase